MTFNELLDRIDRTPRATVRGSGGRKYPYKDLLLAAVLVRIAMGKQLSRRIVLDGALSALYGRLQGELFPDGPSGPPDQPFRHLERSRGGAAVWSLEASGVTQAELARLVAGGADFGSVMRHVECALIDEQAFAELAGSPVARARLAQLLGRKLREAGAVAEELAKLETLMCLGSGDELVPAEPETPESPLLESAIEEHLVENWARSPFAQRGVAFHDRQVPIPTGIVDVLGWQPSERMWWVVELKRGRAADHVVGQLLRYTGWLRREYCRPREDVRGVILAREATHKLDYALSEVPHAELWTFDERLRISPAA